MTDPRDLIQRLARELDHYRQLLRDDSTSTHPFADEARALLAQPEPEKPTKPPGVTLSALLCPAYEPGDGSADGAQLVGAQWWHPEMGCDSLQIVVDNARAVIARCGRPEPQKPTDKDLIQRLLLLAGRAVREALDFEYGDPEDRYIWRELQELKQLAKETNGQA